MTESTRATIAPGPLVEGQRLDQATFHERYEAMPPGIRAELINGVVLMPSPVGPPHGRANALTLMWLGFYEGNTPGFEALLDTSTALGPRASPNLTFSFGFAGTRRQDAGRSAIRPWRPRTAR